MKLYYCLGWLGYQGQQFVQKKKTWAASDGSEREAAGLEPVVRPELGLPAHGSSPDPHAVVPRRAHGARLLGAVAVPPETVGASAAQDRRAS